MKQAPRVKARDHEMRRLREGNSKMLKGVVADGIVSVLHIWVDEGPHAAPRLKIAIRTHPREYLRVAVKVCVSGRDLGIRKVDLRFSGPFGPWLGFSCDRSESEMFQDRFDAPGSSITLITRICPGMLSRSG